MNRASLLSPSYASHLTNANNRIIHGQYQNSSAKPNKSSMHRSTPLQLAKLAQDCLFFKSDSSALTKNKSNNETKDKIPRDIDSVTEDFNEMENDVYDPLGLNGDANQNEDSSELMEIPSSLESLDDEEKQLDQNLELSEAIVNEIDADSSKINAVMQFLKRLFQEENFMSSKEKLHSLVVKHLVNLKKWSQNDLIRNLCTFLLSINDKNPCFIFDRSAVLQNSDQINHPCSWHLTSQFKSSKYSTSESDRNLPFKLKSGHQPPNAALKAQILARSEKASSDRRPSANRSLLERSMYKYQQFINNSTVVQNSNDSSFGISASQQSVFNRSGLNSASAQNSQSQLANAGAIFDSSKYKRSNQIASTASKESKIKLVELDDVEKAKKERRKAAIMAKHQQHYTKPSAMDENSSGSGQAMSPNSQGHFPTSPNTDSSDFINSPLQNVQGSLTPTYASSAQQPKYPFQVQGQMLSPSMPPDAPNYHPAAYMQQQHQQLAADHSTANAAAAAQQSQYAQQQQQKLASQSQLAQPTLTQDEKIQLEISRILSMGEDVNDNDKHALWLFFKGQIENPIDPTQDIHTIVLHKNLPFNFPSQDPQNLNQPQSDSPQQLQHRRLCIDINFKTGDYRMYKD